MNFFDSKTAAKRYAQGRPFIHAKAISLFREIGQVNQPFKRCLDVACGTGQSSVAAAEICDAVVGIDISENMLANAIVHPKVSYRQGCAESLPFDDGSFDLITVGLALHWFDQPVFLKEAYRVLKLKGWLVNYHNEFNRGVPGLPAFKNWFDNEYLKRYPNPPRKNMLGIDEKLVQNLFAIVGNDEYVNEMPLNQEKLIAYLLSQSNIIAAVEQGSEDIKDVTTWLDNATKPFFENNQTRIFFFDGKIWYLQKRKL
jgi:ubiquinone/menaquinone biosynthesis C-methylase UbiE